MATGVTTSQPYYSPQTGITGTPEQHAAALKAKREADARASQSQDFQTQQGQARQQTQADYSAGAQSAPSAGQATRAAAGVSSSTGAGYSVDPYGYTSYNDDAAQQRLTEAQRVRTLRSLLGQYGGADRDPAPSTVQHRGLSINADEEAARAAAFGRAKDQTGLITRGAVDSLRNLYAGTGNVGAQRQGLENIVAGGAGALNEFTRDQLMSDLAREAEISDLTYQGNITQRGQDINRPFSPQLQALVSLMGTLY